MDLVAVSGGGGVPWTELAAGFVGVMVGALVPILHARWMRRKERLGELAAMHTEMHQVHLYWSAMTGPGAKQAPLFRLPVSVFLTAVPKLIGEGLLTMNEAGALLEYMQRVQEINRGLDRAGEAHAQRNLVWLAEECSRNTEKVSSLVSVKTRRLGNSTLFDAAQAAVFRVGKTHLFVRYDDSEPTEADQAPP